MTIQRFSWIIFVLLALYVWMADICYVYGSPSYLYHKYCATINWSLMAAVCMLSLGASILLIVLTKPAQRLLGWVMTGLFLGAVFTTLISWTWYSFPTSLWYAAAWLCGYFGVYLLAYVLGKD